MVYSSYPIRRLREVGVKLLDCDHRTPQPSAFGYPYIAIPNIKDGRLDLSDVRLISKSDFEDWTKRTKPQAGDIILTRRGRVGDTAVVPSNLECAIGQNLVILRSNGSIIDQAYLRWALRSPQYEEQKNKYLNVGAVFDSLNCRDIPEFAVPVPPLHEQRAIAHILGSLDDKIELNRQMNATLEAMAQALFKSWFVDFDPVRAKMEGRQPPGMDAETAALFPDGFEGSVLGEMPRGWQIRTLDDITAFVLGGDWGQDMPTDQATEAAYCIRGADIPDLQAAGLGKMPTRYLKQSSLQKRSLLSGDLIVEISGGSPTQSTGRPVLITDSLIERLSLPIVCSNFCRMIRLTKEVPPILVYMWLRWLYTSDALLQYENGTTGIKNFAYVIFSKQHPLLVPPTSVCNRFAEIASTIFKQRQANGVQSHTLAAIRDALLPKLLSGEIPAIDAMKYLEVNA